MGSGKAYDRRFEATGSLDRPNKTFGTVVSSRRYRNLVRWRRRRLCAFYERAIRRRGPSTLRHFPSSSPRDATAKHRQLLIRLDLKLTYSFAQTYYALLNIRRLYTERVHTVSFLAVVVEFHHADKGFLLNHHLHLRQ